MNDPSTRIQVQTAVFRPIPEAGRSLGTVELLVFGRNFEERASPVVARVGRQQVENIATNPGGTGFSGTVREVPRSGDRLFVGYVDTPLRSTPVVYKASPMVS